MVTGVTRNFNMVLKEVRRVLDVKNRMIGMSILLARGRTLFVADTSIHELPNAEELAEIAIQAAETVRKLGKTPRVAFLSYSTFGNPRATGARRCAKPFASSTPAASTSNMRARCRPNWRSIPKPGRPIPSCACQATPMCW